MESHIELKTEKEKLEKLMYHYANCINALDDVKNHVLLREETYALNKLKDVKEELSNISHLIQEVHDAL